MKSVLIAAALAFAGMPLATLPSNADALVIKTDHDHHGDRRDEDAHLHTGAIVDVHRNHDPALDSGCTTKTVKKSNMSGDKTVTKSKTSCH
jgi:hypothetical protein